MENEKPEKPNEVLHRGGRRPYSIVEIILYTLVAFLLPLAGPIAVIIVVIYFRFRSNSLLVFAICLLVLYGHYNFFFAPEPVAKVPIVRRNIHTMTIAIERYALDHDRNYPSSIDDLFNDYLVSMPVNPYTDEPTRIIPFGSTPFEGKMTYVTSTVGDDVVGYYIFGYCEESWPGEDVDGDGEPDHVIIVLSSDDERPEEETYLPPLKVLLGNCIQQ